MMRRCERDHAEAGRGWVLAIGIDNLGLVEELFGEGSAEEAVVVVGRRLARAIPAGAEIERIRHRRFLVRSGGGGARTVTALFARLQAAADGLIETSCGPFAITISAGAVQGEAGPEDARRAALQALHGALAHGVGSLRIADDPLSLDESRERLAAIARVAAGALGDGDGKLTAAFQPVVRASGGTVIAFHECLARIRRPDGEVMPAAAFMPAIERLGMAPLIDRRVLAITLDTLARHRAVRLSVNVFPPTMQDAAWMATLDDAVARDPGLAERLIVEVTETCSMLDPRRTLAFMDRLRGHGVAFALDDFGAGHSSLGHLRDFRFDIVKIDGRFARDIRPGSDDAFCVARLVEIARHFEMMTVAEGVHGPAEARCLADCGIEYFQGFHFGLPSLALCPTASPMPGIAAQA